MNYMQNEKKYIELLKERLDEYRFIHSLNVAKSAVLLAEKYGADKDKAYIAGLLHDVTKNDSQEKQLQLINENCIILTNTEQNNPKLWHAISGMCFLKAKLGIDDEEILGAVRYHTTGKAGMTLLEKVIYIADYISEEREYPDVDVMRELSGESLEKASLYALKFSLRSLSKKEKPIHEDSVAYYNELVIQSMKGLI